MTMQISPRSNAVRSTQASPRTAASDFADAVTVADGFDARTTAAQAATAGTTTAKVLRRGDTGDAVKRWQNHLVALGYLTKAQMATGPGIYGPQTEAATKRFQADHRLTQNGTTDSGTRRAMWKALDAKEQYASVTLSRGMQNDAVRQWQQQLVQAGYLTQSQMATGPGIFGPQTEAATRRFQADHGLNVSGQVGSGTRAAMKKALAGGSPTTPTTPSKPSDGPAKVPYISQLYSEGTADDWNRNANCGPATVAMIARAFGFKPDWSDGSLVNWLGGQAGVGGNGAGWPQIQTMANAAGLSASQPMYGHDLNWIRSQLSQGKIIAANGNRAVTLANSSSNDGVTGGHWIVVYGTDANGNFLVQDPSTDCKVLTPSELQRYFDWRDGGGVSVAIG